MLNKWRRLFHLSRVKLLLVKMSASWCLVSMYRIWILESRLILSNNQSKAILWVLDTCLIVESHCGTSAFYYHLNHGFIVLKHTTQHWKEKVFRLMERDQYWSDRDWCAQLESVFACLVECLPTSFSVALLHLWFCCCVLVRNEIFQSPNPKEWEREYRPMRKPASRKIISASVELCETEVWFLHIQLIGTDVRLPKIHRILLMLISRLQGLLQNQGLGTILICIVVLCFTRDNVACIHMCHEYTRSNTSSVCRKLLSIFWPHEQVYSQTIMYQVYQNEPNIDFTKQFVSRLWTIFQLIHFLLLL